MHPVITFLQERRRNRLSDIEFLAIKEFENKFVSDEAAVAAGAAPADGASLTAGAGKDLYLAKAKISASNLSGGASLRFVEMELQIAGIVRESVTLNLNDPGVDGFESIYTFALSGVKVGAGSIIKIRVISNSDIGVESVLTGWEEDTGDNPQITT